MHYKSFVVKTVSSHIAETQKFVSPRRAAGHQYLFSWSVQRMLVTIIQEMLSSVSLDAQIVIVERIDLGVDDPEHIFWFCSLKTSFSYSCDGKLQSRLVSLSLCR